MAKNETHHKTVVGPIFRLTLIFFLSQIAIVFYLKQIYFSDMTLEFLKTQALSSGYVLLGWGWFALMQLLLYAVFIFILWFLARTSGYLLNLSWDNTRLLGVIIFLVALLFLLFANTYYFPNSIFSFWPLFIKTQFHLTFSSSILYGITLIFGALLCIFVIMSCLGVLRWLVKHPLIFILLLIIAAVCIGYFYYVKNKDPSAIPMAQKNAPNIILIGIDSLRPNDLTYFGEKTERMPTVDDFLKHSTVFAHALTPSARTSPAWASILTGNDPKITNVQFNLTNPKYFNISQTLGDILKKHGYYTVYATDDRLFNQINEAFGFQKIIGPKMGMNGFLFSQLNDFPLSNLVINFPVSKILFPYNYINRGSAVTYYPQTFDAVLTKKINAFPKTKPLFLAVHFALPHWPYYDATIPAPKKFANTAAPVDVMKTYYQTLPATDAQINHLLTLLKQEGYLNNTLVILLSDHGNSFGMPHDRITQKQNYVPAGTTPPFQFYTENLSYGHGTDVLTLEQYHIVLAARLFSNASQFVGKKTSVTSLIDIMPTVLNFLNISANKPMQGISLLPLITSSAELNQPRSVFIESEFSLPGLLSATPKAEVVLNQGIPYYEVICKTGMLTMNPVYVPMVIKGKNRAVISVPWMLAYYPHFNEPGTLVLVNLVTKQWTTDMHSAFATSAPVAGLETQLKQFYDNDITLNPATDLQAAATPTNALPTPPTAIAPITPTTGGASVTSAAGTPSSITPIMQNTTTSHVIAAPVTTAKGAVTSSTATNNTMPNTTSTQAATTMQPTTTQTKITANVPS